MLSCINYVLYNLSASPISGIRHYNRQHTHTQFQVGGAEESVIFLIVPITHLSTRYTRSYRPSVSPDLSGNQMAAPLYKTKLGRPKTRSTPAYCPVDPTVFLVSPFDIHCPLRTGVIKWSRPYKTKLSRPGYKKFRKSVGCAHTRTKTHSQP